MNFSPSSARNAPSTTTPPASSCFSCSMPGARAILRPSRAGKGSHRCCLREGRGGVADRHVQGDFAAAGGRRRHGFGAAPVDGGRNGRSVRCVSRHDAGIDGGGLRRFSEAGLPAIDLTPRLCILCDGLLARGSNRWGGKVYTGDVWSFVATPNIAYSPYPRDGDKWIDVDDVLTGQPGRKAMAMKYSSAWTGRPWRLAMRGVFRGGSDAQAYIPDPDGCRRHLLLGG